MPCTEAYKERIMYTFNGFLKTVIRYAALNAWRAIENGHTEDSIKQRLVAALFKFRFDEQPYRKTE